MTTPQKGERVISEAASHKMRELMRLVVTDGTGSKADVPGYEVGGKTGTADKPVNGSYATAPPDFVLRRRLSDVTAPISRLRHDR